MAVNELKTSMQLRQHFFFEIRTKIAFPQSVRFNYVLTDNSKDRLIFRRLYWSSIFNSHPNHRNSRETSPKHHGPGHREYKNISSEAKCSGFSLTEVIVLKS